ncbi:MAG: MAPEG family protein [Rhodobacteraceae bacterium]|nr:MAPEG family protein [Paracoccaceae bacterium]
MQYMPLDLKIAVFSMFAQVLLTFYAVIKVGVTRITAVRQHGIRLSDVAFDASGYPEFARRHGNNLANQFEFPILLYVGVMLAVLFDASSMLFAIFCLGFVISRYYHRLVHVRSNRVVLRFQVFVAGIIMLFFAWVVLGFNLLMAEFAG